VKYLLVLEVKLYERTRKDVRRVSS